MKKLKTLCLSLAGLGLAATPALAADAVKLRHADPESFFKLIAGLGAQIAGQGTSRGAHGPEGDS